MSPIRFFNSAAYLELEAERLHGDPLLIAEPAGALGLIMRRIPGTESRDGVSVYGYPDLDQRCSVTAADTSAILDVLRRAAARHDLVSAYVRVGVTQSIDLDGAEGSCRIQQVGDVVVVDLNQSADEIFRGFRKNVRYDLRRAKPLAIGPSDDIKAFHGIYTENMERVGARGEYLFSLEYLRRFVNLEGATLVLADDGASVVAGALLVQHGDTLFYHLGATATRSLVDSPLKSLLGWICGEYSRRLSMFVLGGGLGGGDDSLLRFKQGFSPTMCPVYGIKAVFNSEQYRELSGFVSNEDPFAGHFPSYRNLH